MEKLEESVRSVSDADKSPFGTIELYKHYADYLVCGKCHVTARNCHNWQEMVGLNTYGKLPYLNHLHINFSKSLKHHSLLAFIVLQQFEGLNQECTNFSQICK
jgi:hypothetical protein